MVSCLEKIDGNAEFHQIVDFLTTSPIHYALTVSPTIYASYIEQFWATAKSKTVNDMKQIHATIDGKTVVISESLVRSDLHFNDEDGIACLSNDEIFENLALMGYERVSTKLTFKKAFFSPQWKYLIHTILHCLSSKSTAWNEFSTNIASAVICLANNQKFNFSKLIFNYMLRNLDPTYKKFLMYPRFLQLFLNNQIALAEPFNDVCVTPVHTKKVFTNLKRQNKDFSRKITPLFSSMLVPPIVEGEGSGQPSEPQPPSSTAPPYHEVQVTTVASQPQKTHTPRRAKRGRDTKIPQSSGPLKKVGDEAVYTGEDDRMVRAATTTTSLEAEQENGSGPRCQDTTLGDADAQTRVLALEHSKTAQDLVIKKLQKKVKRLEKALRARTPGMKLYKIGTFKRKSLDKENVSKLGRKLKTRSVFEEGDYDGDDDMVNRAIENVEGDIINAGGAVSTVTTGVSAASASVTTTGVSISTAEPRTHPTTTTTAFEDKDLTIAQTFVKIIREKAKAKELLLEMERAAEQEAKDATLIEQIEDVQARMDADVLLAERLQQEEREQFTVDEQARMLVDLIVERKRFFAAQRDEQIRNKPPTRAQLRNKMVTYLKHMGKYTHNQLKSKSFEEIQKLYEKEQKWINDFVPMDDESKKEAESSQKQAESSKKRPRAAYDEESVKKQKIEDDAKKEKLRACMDIVLGDDIAINVESLATKYSIVDWKIHILTENMMYYQIIRADRSFKNYKIFSGMLDDFDRQDVVDLYRLVKERYETTSPEGYDLLLWGDLNILFEPCEEDEIWRNQQDYNLIS
ncbi:hypothetical protein Tco_0389873 [Tanacetum coccineum]